MNNIFNTELEISMRLLLVLSQSENKKLTFDSLVLADFIANYSKEFELSNRNLHGENNLNFAEFAKRRTLSQISIKSLVIENLINVSSTKDGFLYFITDRGKQFINSLSSDYADEYKVHVRKSLFYMSSKSEIELLNMINKEALRTRQRR